MQADTSGDFSANSGNHNDFGSSSSLNTLTNIQTIYQACVFGAGERDEAPRPDRIIPYDRNSEFTGRKGLIESIKRHSEGDGHHRIALHGLGGSGKTQIALEYVYQRASDADCDVFWVQGSGVLKFIDGFRAIAHHVRIPLPSAETDQEQFLASIKGWFEGPDSGHWILVIDNADNEEDFIGNSGPISKFLPQGQGGTPIFTTRSLRVATWQGCERIDVGRMGEDEAQSLFSKRFGSWNLSSDEEKEAAEMILSAVHDSPLAIVGATAFMAETQTPPSAYWRILRGSEEQARRLISQPFCNIKPEADMTASILATYLITFERITLKVPLAANILRLMAVFDRQNIPAELLNQSCLERIDGPMEFRLAIGRLLGFSLVTTVNREDQAFYELHRLVQLSLQVYLPTEELDQLRATALGMILRFLPQDENKWRDVDRTYIPHALAVAKGSTDPIAEELCFRLGQYFRDMGSYNNAESQFRRCIALREKSKEYDWDGEGPMRVIHLGVVVAYQGKAEVAEEIFQNFLEDMVPSLGSDNPTVLRAVHCLGIVLRYQGKYNESEEMNRRALERREIILGPDHLDTLRSASNLATVLQYQQKYNESEALILRALEGYQKCLGQNHLTFLQSANNLAIVLQYQRKHNESEMLNRHVLEGYEKVLGPDHPDTLSSANNLAAVLRYQGRYSESEQMNRRILEARKRILGPDHPNTLSSTNNLAIVLQYQGKYSESEELNQRALARFEKIPGPNHPDNLSSARNLTFLQRSQGESRDSEMIGRNTQRALPTNPSETTTQFASRVVRYLWRSVGNFYFFLYVLFIFSCYFLYTYFF
ncbi:unnamed protein product [Tuber aestivum]|uniref:NB-ARC domain-containing protein n=1 Tax=Tuber aestivum TaxID=59557 RepID=A0A292Q0C6_9PEZI|nr:unnamed protein product [Tuber aestivum]